MTPAALSKDLNAMDVDRGCQYQTVEQGAESATTTASHLFQVQEARASGKELQVKDGCESNDV